MSKYSFDNFIWDIFCLRSGRITHCSQLDALTYKVLVNVLKVGIWQIILMLLSTKYLRTKILQFSYSPFFHELSVEQCNFVYLIDTNANFFCKCYQGNVAAKYQYLIFYYMVEYACIFSVLGLEYFGTKSVKIFFRLNFVSLVLTSIWIMWSTCYFMSDKLHSIKKWPR